MRRDSILAAAAAGMLLAGPVTAAAAMPDTFELGTIEVLQVTGERQSDWYAPMEPAVNIEDARRFDRQDIGEAASLLPGVNIQHVGPRNERLVFVRGFNSRQVPLFVDGVPVYVPYDGNIDFSRLTTADIAEVSVTKGFTSMLFGANTLGGSINVVTRRPAERVSVDAGGTVVLDSHAEASGGDAYLNVGTNRGSWYAQLGASYYETDFFTLPKDFNPTTVEDGGRRDNSGSENLKTAIKVGWTPNESDEYALSYQNLQSEKGTPPYAGSDPSVRARFWQWPEYDKESLYFIARKGLGEKHYARFRVYYDAFDNTLRSFDDGSYSTQSRPYAFTSVYDDYSWGASLEAGLLATERHDLRAAFHYKDDVHREIDTDGAPEERYEDQWYSMGVEDRFLWADDWTILAGVSYDVLEGRRADDVANGPGAQFQLTTESAVNAQAGMLHDFSDQLSGRFSVSKRTRFPTIKDRYSFRLGSAIPNPRLQPEAALNLELGLDGSNDLAAGGIGLTWAIALFYSEIDDAIESVTIEPHICAQPPCTQLRNVGEQTSRGVETMLTASLGTRWMLHANYTYLEKENDSSPGLEPLDVPQHSVFSYLSFNPSQRWTFQATVEYGSSRFSSTDGVRVAGDFAIGSIKAFWRPATHLQLEAGVRNFSDELYAFEEGFYEPGRRYYTTLRWRN